MNERDNTTLSSTDDMSRRSPTKQGESSVATKEKAHASQHPTAELGENDRKQMSNYVAFVDTQAKEYTKQLNEEYQKRYSGGQ